MRSALVLSALLLSAACAPSPQAQAQREAAQAQFNENVQASADAILRPAIQACVPYATGGALDTASLSRAGFAPRQTPLGTTIIENGDIYAVTNDRRGVCRVSWRDSFRTVPVGGALRAAMSDAGFEPAGNSGNRQLFSDGTQTISVRATYVQSSGVRQWDVILFRP